MEIRLKDVEAIYHSALEKTSAAERSAFLDVACKGNPELRAQVELLLRAHESAGDFLRTPVGHPDLNADSMPLTEGPGTVVGRYKLLEKIGEGGMAVVYMAEQQEPIRREVALKIIKLGMDTKQVIARFEAERQALALMDHPNIAKVLDAGATETGRPYFVMELVQGLSITEYCDQNNLGNKERLDLFIQVCNAVQHAHQKGIIHRDIKPTNVMVTVQDSRAVPKVIDFGIAKATDRQLTERTLFTRFSQIIGTPAYMSPEQAGLSEFDIDTRTDIYSLGVLLYELLTGTTPFSEEELRQAGYAEMTRIIREKDPPKPSTRLTQLLTNADSRRKLASSYSPLATDLDWIVMKSLEKERDHRYGAPQEFAADITRYLNHEPVQAAPPTVSYRLRKYARRHRVGVLIGLSAFLMILVTLCVLAISTAVVWRAQGRTQQALEREQKALSEETQARTQAETLRAQEASARQEAERQARIAQAVTAFLNNDLLASIDPARARGRQVTVREILDVAARRIQDRFPEEPLVEASVRQTLGSTYETLGEYAEAAAQLQRAYQLYSEHLQQDDPVLIEAMRTLAWLYICQGQYALAEPLLLKARAVSERTWGDEHKLTLGILHSLAVLYKDLGRYDQAEELNLKVIAVARRIHGGSHLDTLNAMHNLASLYQEQKRFSEANTLFQQVLEIKTRAFGEDHPDTARSLGNLGLLFKEQQRYDIAEEMFLKTLDIMKRVLGEEHPDTLRTMHNLVSLYAVQMRRAEAESLLRHILLIKERVLGTDHQGTMSTVNSLAILLSQQGRFAEAETLFVRALDTHTGVLGTDHPETLNSLHNLATLYRDQQQYDKAEPLYIQAVQGRQRVLGQGHRDTLKSLDLLVGLYDTWGKPEQAKTWRAMSLEHKAEPETASAIPPKNQASPAGDSPRVSRVSSPPVTDRILVRAERLVAAGSMASWSPDGNRLVFGKPKGDGLLILDMQTGRITDLAPSGKDPAWSPDGRVIAYVDTATSQSPEEVWLVEPNGTRPQRLVDGGFPSWSARGESLYVQSRQQNHILCFKGTDFTVRPTVFYSGPQSWYPAISPDGLRLAFGRTNVLEIVDRQSQIPVLIWPTPGHRGLLPAWSPDGRQVAFGGFDSEPMGIWVLDVESKKAVQVAEGSYTLPVWSPDGTKLAFDLRSGDIREIWMVDTQTLQDLRADRAGTELLTGPSPDPRPGAQAMTNESANRPSTETNLPPRTLLVAAGLGSSWSPDGTRLAYCMWTGQRAGLRILDTASGQTTMLNSEGKDPAWSPDGRYIAYTQGRGASDVTWLVEPSGEAPRRLMAGGHPGWSADGKTLYVQSRQENRIFSLRVDDPGSQPQVFYDGPQSWYPAVSPDGNRIAFGRRDELVIMDRMTQQLVLVWPVPGHRGLLPEWSPDGTRVAFGGFDGEPLGLWILDVDGQAAVRIADKSHTAPNWSRDGTKLAIDRHDGDVREIWLIETQAIPSPAVKADQAAKLSLAALHDRTDRQRNPAPQPEQVLLVGKTPPAFTQKDLHGQQVSLSDFRGKVVLLDFWATWCPPCVRAIPYLEGLYGKYQEQGLVVIGLNREEDHAKVRQFADGRISYPVLLDAKRPFAEYGISDIPRLFYLDRDGTVRYQDNGFDEKNKEAIEVRITELLNSGTEEKATMPQSHS